MDKTKLYWLTNHEDYREKSVITDKISEHKYRVLEFGKFKPILNDIQLIDNSVVEILKKHASDQIEVINRVAIWRKSTDEVWTNYSEIVLKNNLTLKSFPDAKHDGFRIYLLMNDRIYISSDLMDKLISECEKINELDFIKDWPLYG